MQFQHAAARRRLADDVARIGIDNRFNTQPPEGGWLRGCYQKPAYCLFQHAAARRRLAQLKNSYHGLVTFQHAAARRRLVGIRTHQERTFVVSTRSRPKAAGRRQRRPAVARRVSTRSRPKAAGRRRARNSTPRAVSTRSRPKAAGRPHESAACLHAGFNTQPPEGGWSWLLLCLGYYDCFNTQPPEGGWIKRGLF